MDNKNYYALSFLSADSKGLVSEATKILYENGFNIADSSSTLLQGIFSMIFIVTSDKDLYEHQLQELFKSSRFIPNVYRFKKQNYEPTGNNYSISVYGADKPGIVHEITSIIAEFNINIIDLQTKVTGRHSSKVYIMILEVEVPENVSEKDWTKALSEKAKEIKTDVTYKKIDTYEF